MGHRVAADFQPRPAPSPCGSTRTWARSPTGGRGHQTSERGPRIGAGPVCKPLFVVSPLRWWGGGCGVRDRSTTVTTPPSLTHTAKVGGGDSSSRSAPSSASRPRSVAAGARHTPAGPGDSHPPECAPTAEIPGAWRGCGGGGVRPPCRLEWPSVCCLPTDDVARVVRGRAHTGVPAPAASAPRQCRSLCVVRFSPLFSTVRTGSVASLRRFSCDAAVAPVGAPPFLCWCRVASLVHSRVAPGDGAHPFGGTASLSSPAPVSSLTTPS